MNFKEFSINEMAATDEKAFLTFYYNNAKTGMPRATSSKFRQQ